MENENGKHVLKFDQQMTECMMSQKRKQQVVAMLCAVVLIALTTSVAHAQISSDCQEHINGVLESLKNDNQMLETDYFGAIQNSLSHFTDAEPSELTGQCLSSSMPFLPITEECEVQFDVVFKTLEEANQKIQDDDFYHTMSTEVIKSLTKQYQLLRSKCSLP
ncbi:uncharacterized protein [Spinacia oleracea]|uniref:Uncharacterized protein isoform X2 n=1 Tax=Spinacia oleracea TaxID=3562 RepID=A0ABM3R9K4_SPIOL|nr:uncharacterized protein LOC130467704 isoform X2 [Spinacia oleracea]